MELNNRVNSILYEWLRCRRQEKKRKKEKKENLNKEGSLTGDISRSASEEESPSVLLLAGLR